MVKNLSKTNDVPVIFHASGVNSRSCAILQGFFFKYVFPEGGLPMKKYNQKALPEIL
jgi:hypothetical protein